MTYTTSHKLSERTATDWLLGTGVWALLVLVIPLLIVFLGPERIATLETAIALGFVAYSGTRMAWLSTLREVRPIESVLHLFVYTTLGIVPLCQSITERTSYLIAPQYLQSASLIAGIGVIAFDIGAVLAVRSSVQQRFSTNRFIDLRVDRACLVALSVFATGATTAYIVSVGGVSTFFGSRQERRIGVETSLGGGDSQAAVGAISALGTAPILVAFACWIVAASPRVDFAPSRFWLLVTLALNAIVNNPISNSRYWTLTVLFAVICAYAALRPFAFRIIVISGVIASITIFPFSDIFRYDESGLVKREGSNIAEVLATKDYDQLTMTANGIWMVDGIGHTLGRQLAGSLLFWVPRSLWPEKPQDTGVAIGEAMAVPNTNLSSPLWLEAWIDFGLLGVAIVLCGAGLIARGLDYSYDLHRHCRPYYLSCTTVLVPLVAGYTFILLRGPLLQSMGRFAVILGCVAFLCYRSRRSDSENVQPPNACNANTAAQLPARKANVAFSNAVNVG
ncbi:hypothetical protein [Rhodococcus ruber]|uniref:hypothetical protein n=1 Tax=Rhodococcus ruber TaxID=1830 RepID=UPI001124835F|nr:hypothetical protein [Rhodococcus ruber]QDC15941.1 hypothetical protein E2561_18985 [Rhodococcus ruber]